MTYRTVNPAGAKELLDGGDAWTYVDVRTVEEFDAGHVPGSYNVPAFLRGPGGMAPNPDFVALMKKHFPADTKLVIGCAAGGRSARACEALEAEGYGDLANMHGGFTGAADATGAVTEPGWSACGYPTSTEPTGGRSYTELA